MQKNSPVQFLVNVFFVLLPVLLWGCGKDASQGNLAHIGSQIIVGSVDWQDVEDLSANSKERRNANAVAHLELPVLGSRCTGFMISNDLLMTNQHCIPAAQYAKGVVATFRYEKSISSANRVKYDCSEFVANDETLDFAILKCKNSPGLKEGKVELSQQEAPVGNNIYVIHQNCDYYNDRTCDPTKKFSAGKVTELKDEISHNADTLGGSSGSPLFDKSSGKVVGLHHAGYGNNGMGRGVVNYAVPMEKIVSFFASDLPNVYSSVFSSGNTQTPAKKEPGSTFESALDVEFLKSYQFSITQANDVDFFKINAPASSTVSIELFFSHNKGDLDFYFYNKSGSLVAKRESASDNETLHIKLKGGEYYLKVFGYRGALNSYELKVSKK